MESYTVPPVYEMPQTAQDITLAVFGAMAAGLLGYAIYLTVKYRSPMPVLLWIAGGATIFLEPVADVMGNAVHSQIGQNTAFTVEGHPVPWHVVIAYPWYFGALPIFMYSRMREQSVPKTAWWKIGAAALLAVTVVEQVPVHFDVWHYYGEHPLKIGYMPLGMIFANIACVMLPALVLYKLMPILKGWKQMLVIGLTPAFAMAGHAGAGLLSYNALGTDTETVSPILLQGSGIATILLALLMIWAMLEIVYWRDPRDRRDDAAADREPLAAEVAAPVQPEREPAVV